MVDPEAYNELIRATVGEMTPQTVGMVLSIVIVFLVFMGFSRLIKRV
jgi:hypothetical protein